MQYSIDSDSRFPGDRPNEQIAKDLSADVAFVHVLEGRTIENYVPLEYARRRLAEDGLADAGDAYFRMADAQRRHFPLKKGFKDTAFQPLSHQAFLADATLEAAERDHYRTVNPIEWIRFSAGFGNRLADVYQEAGYRCSPNEKGRLTQTQQRELNEFFSRVIRYL